MNDPCKCINNLSPLGRVPPPTGWSSSAIKWLFNPSVPSLGCFWDALAASGLVLVPLLIYKILPKKASEVVVMAYFVASCCYWAGTDPFGVLLRNSIVVFTTMTVLAFAWIWQKAGKHARRMRNFGADKAGSQGVQQELPRPVWNSGCFHCCIARALLRLEEEREGLGVLVLILYGSAAFFRTSSLWARGQAETSQCASMTRTLRYLRTWHR